MTALEAAIRGAGKSRVWLRLLPWLVLPLLIAWAWKDIPLADIFSVFHQLELREASVLVALNLVILLLFNLRWWVFLQWLGYSLPYMELFGKKLAGYGVSYFTPGPQFGGEPLLVYLLHRQGVKGSAALASVTLDKMMELLANFTFLAGGVGLALAGGSKPASFLLALPVLLLSLPLAYFAALWAGILPAAGLLRRALYKQGKPWLVRLHQQVEAAESLASDMFRRRKASVFGLFLFSMAVWGLSLLEYWLMMRFLGLALTPTQALLGLTSARLAFLLPLPGGAGVLEASQVLAMQQLGLAAAYGAGAGLLIRVRDVLIAGTGLILGAYYLQKGTGPNNLVTGQFIEEEG